MMKTFGDYNLSYNYCRICGHVPGRMDEPNRAPIRFWEPDDGWVISTLCRWCYNEYGHVQPDPDDYAYPDFYGDDANGMPLVETDEDPLEAF